MLTLSVGLATRITYAANPTELDLESLLSSTISSASKYKQNQSEVPASVSVITRDDIRAFGWRTLHEALNSLPGIHTTYDYQYHYLGVRGFGLPGDFNTRILLAINGNRMNDVVYDGAQVGREFPLDIDLIEKIEYIIGPGGAVYGQNAMLAVVNIITRSGFQVDGSELMVLQSEPQDQSEVALRWGKRLQNGTDLLFSASGLTSQGTNLLLTFPGQGPGGTDMIGEARGLDKERDREFFAELAQGPWSFNLIYGLRNKADPTASFASDIFAPDLNSRDSYLISQLQYDASYFENNLDVQGRLFTGRQRYLGNSQYSGLRYYSTGDSNWQGGEVRLVYRAIPRHTLMLGVEGQNNSRADQRYYDELMTTTNVDIPSTGYRVGMYVQDEWQIRQRWRTTVGARIDHNNMTGTQLSPRMALIWQAFDNTAIKALLGRAWRAPNVYESFYDDDSSLTSNLQLKGERNDTQELSVEQRLSSNVSVRASAYQWEITDIIQLGIEPNSGIPQYANGSKVKTHAFEFAMNGAWSSGARMWASFAYQDVSYPLAGKAVNSPEELGKLSYSIPLSSLGLRLAWELQYDGERQTLAGTSVGRDWLSHLTFSAEKPWHGVSWSLSFRNIFDHYYELPAADTNWQDTLEQPRRQIRLLMNYRF
jgi:outer membrane receptor for ferrienterochelin and colicin